VFDEKVPVDLFEGFKGDGFGAWGNEESLDGGAGFLDCKNVGLSADCKGWGQAVDGP